jgi:hypothetical protein
MEIKSRKLYGSICISDLITELKKQHSSFSKAKNDKIYGNITVWINEKPDEYGNEASLQLTPKKDTEDKNVYFGNMKFATQDTPKVIEPDFLDEIADIDDLPF